MRKNYISALSVLSAFAVVALHINAFWIYSRTFSWITSCFSESLFYFAVPVFFMISGATLMDFRSHMDTGQYLKKRITRTVIPYLFWLTVAILFHFLVVEPGPLPGVHDFLAMVLIPPDWSYFWFFISLFALYASLLLLSWIPASSRQTTLLWSALVCFGCITAFPWLCGKAGLSWPWQLDGNVFGPVMYACLGWVLANWKPKKRSFWLLMAAGLGSFAYFFLATALTSWKADALVEIGRGYYNWPCIVYASAIFTGMKALCEKHPFPFDALQKYTFGIYLMQNLIISWIIKYRYDLVIGWKIRPFVVVSVFSFLLCLSWVLKKIPAIRTLL